MKQNSKNQRAKMYLSSITQLSILFLCGPAITANAQDVATIMKDHATLLFQDQALQTTGATTECLVASSTDASTCLVPSKAATLNSLGDHLLIVRRGAGSFSLPSLEDTADHAGTVSLTFQQSLPGVPENIDVTDRIRKNTITFSCDDSIGVYQLKNDASGVLLQTIVVLFNPFAAACSEYTHGLSEQEYVLSTEGLLWQGLSDNNEAHVWDFDQFRGINLLVSLHLLRSLTYEHRALPVAVARVLSFAVNEDMCSGKWGEGNYEFDNDEGWKDMDANEYKCAGPEQFESTDQWVSKCTDPTSWMGTTMITEQYWARHHLVQ